MISWYIHRRMSRFEREYDYDMAYGRDLLDAGTKAAILFFRAAGLGDYREGVSKEAWHAAKLITSKSEDCGPCLRLTVTMAERDGVRPEVIRSLLEGALSELPEEVSLSARFTLAVQRRDLEADVLRERILARFGRRGLVSLAFAMIAARMYPTLKYALGHGHTCESVRIEEVPVMVEATGR